MNRRALLTQEKKNTHPNFQGVGVSKQKGLEEGNSDTRSVKDFVVSGFFLKATL